MRLITLNKSYKVYMNKSTTFIYKKKIPHHFAPTWDKTFSVTHVCSSVPLFVTRPDYFSVPASGDAGKIPPPPPSLFKFRDRSANVGHKLLEHFFQLYIAEKPPTLKLNSSVMQGTSYTTRLPARRLNF